MKTHIVLGTTIALIALVPAQANQQLVQQYQCTSCHENKGKKKLGPSYEDIVKKYAGQANAEARLFGSIKTGSVGAWGQVPMPPHKTIPDNDLRAIVKWIMAPASQYFAAPTVRVPLTIEEARRKCQDEQGIRPLTQAFDKCVGQLSN